jgi:hypothetical protein
MLSQTLDQFEPLDGFVSTTEKWAVVTPLTTFIVWVLNVTVGFGWTVKGMAGDVLGPYVAFPE